MEIIPLPIPNRSLPVFDRLSPALDPPIGRVEIDKTFRKVDEQQEVFQQIFDRLHECDQSLKEKYEVKCFIV